MDDAGEWALAANRAELFKAMGHPTRAYMVAVLAETELSVGELAERIGNDISTVSKHLSVLRKAGLLSVRKDGARSLYSLSCSCIMEFVHCIDDVIADDATARLACVARRPKS